jgi:hypothetical protein
VHLGFEGYRAVALDDLKNARLLSRALEGSGYYTVLSDVHRRVGGGVGDGKELGAAEGAAGFDQEDVEVCWLVGPFFVGLISCLEELCSRIAGCVFPFLGRM